MTKKAYYQRLWKCYSQGVTGETLMECDRLVAREALRAKEPPKDVALMLFAASPYVQGMAAMQEVKQGSQERMYVVTNYVEQTVRAATEMPRKQILRQK
jgi:hypothetical protein